MKYRNRTDIIPAVLEAANGGANKTRLMYSTYLSYTQLKEYLSLLVEKNLVTYDDSSGKFRTTEKGLRVLKIYNHINEELNVSNTLAVSKIIGG